MRHWTLSRNALKETEFVWDEHGIIFNEKVLNKYDRFVLDFTLEKEKIRYVLLSGYVAILFGRSRQTEDIDLGEASTPFGAAFSHFFF